MYGTLDAIRHAVATQARMIPFPIETVIPISTGAEGCPTRKLFMSSAFLTMTVQMITPTRSNRLPRIAKTVEARKPIVCLSRPLRTIDGT